MDKNTSPFELARVIAANLEHIPQVEAVALGGSLIGTVRDQASDIDLYIYSHQPIPIDERIRLVETTGGARNADLNLDYWGPGDEWINQATGIEVDLTFFNCEWMESQLMRVVEQHLPSLGYTTCFWHTFLGSTILVDRQSWYSKTKQRFDIPYPEPLRQNIVAYNYPVLRGIIPSYSGQIAKAVDRQDWVSVNHRLAALLASYFDILFAVNRIRHPGEKRLLVLAHRLCSRLPQGVDEDVEAVLAASVNMGGNLLANLERLLDHLEAFLLQEGLIPTLKQNDSED